MEGNHTTGIARKLADIEEKIKEISSQIKTLDNDINKKKLEMNINEQMKDIRNNIEDIRDKIEMKKKEINAEENLQQQNYLQEQLIQLQEEKDQLQEQLIKLREEKDQLQEEKDVLQEKRNGLQQELIQLNGQFSEGEYYAFTNAYWGIGDTRREGNAWDSFVREFGDREHFHCRYAEKDSPAVKSTDPFVITREGALEETYSAADSKTTRTSAMPQSDSSARNLVWPTDIFGNESSAKVAHLLPAGKGSHKHWLNVACAVLGIGRSADIKIKKKAVAGYKTKNDKDDPSTQQQDGTSASNASNRSMDDSATKKASPRKPGTGVVHFVANKIRLLNQESVLDGPTPTCLIVPVMTLEDARNWRGEGYTAICFAGIPENSAYNVVHNGTLYVNIGLTAAALTKVELTRDAENVEVERARLLLEQAVLALHDMIAGRSDEELEYVDSSRSGLKALKDARTVAKTRECKVPRSVQRLGRKPACLITFGGFDETKMHPAPDPLLLVLRAANTFGIMAGIKMMASASPEDLDDISIGDIMEEEAFLEAREQSFRPKSWADLANGLGQANGYVASIGESIDSFFRQ